MYNYDLSYTVHLYDTLRCQTMKGYLVRKLKENRETSDKNINTVLSVFCTVLLVTYFTIFQLAVFR
jgi:hypothetical protein